jgi:hypothetical protein
MNREEFIRSNFLREAQRNQWLMRRIREDAGMMTTYSPPPQEEPKRSKLKTAAKVVGAGLVGAAGAGAVAGFLRRRSETLARMRAAYETVGKSTNTHFGGKSKVLKDKAMDKIQQNLFAHKGYLGRMAQGAWYGIRHPEGTAKTIYKHTLGRFDD